jgi:predicted Fe-Mo cluster-binding NifX family protein
MRIAVTAKSPTLDSQVDQRFGRTKCFIVYDTETRATEVHDNEVNLNAAQGAGIQSAANIAQLGVEAVLTGHVGPNSFRTLSAAKITAYIGLKGTVAEAIEEFKAGKMTPANSADVEAHWII